MNEPKSKTNGNFIFEDRTLTINWEMLPDISVFTTSYKVLTDSLSTYNYLIIGKFIYTLCSGFTTVELLIVMLILLFVTGVATLTYFTAVNTTRDVISISTSEIDARTAIYRMSKDIREATSISLADEDKIRFTSNIDSDDSFEEVYYFLENENGYYNNPVGAFAIIADPLAGELS